VPTLLRWARIQLTLNSVYVSVPSLLPVELLRFPPGYARPGVLADRCIRVSKAVERAG
jgi:hypothetical protein